MAHDAEYAQKAFLKQKDERKEMEATRHEIQRLQESMNRLTGTVDALHKDLLAIKQDIYVKA